MSSSPTCVTSSFASATTSPLPRPSQSTFPSASLAFLIRSPSVGPQLAPQDVKPKKGLTTTLLLLATIVLHSAGQGGSFISLNVRTMVKSAHSVLSQSRPIMCVGGGGGGGGCGSHYTIDCQLRA